jgi:tRNA A37 threonylcarbamoyladenosine dehydratase
LPAQPAEKSGCGSGNCVCPQNVHESDVAGDAIVHEWCSKKKQINGSAVHITGTFGFFLAGMVIQDVVKRAENT